jgi:curved DNA-binding protein
LQPDLYDLLAVSRSSGDEELKKAYRKQALRFHPDRNPGDKEAERRFKEVTYAYKVLSDPVKRVQYDRFGRVFSDGRDQGPFGAADEVDLGEVLGQAFKDLFGGRKRRARRDRRDLRYTITLSLEEVAAGVDREVTFQRQTEGGGTSEERLRVKVPPGVDTGQKLKIAGKGASGMQGAGDLYVVVNVADHGFFKRQGANLFCDVPVTYTELVCGGEIAVPTLGGEALIRLPAGKAPGTVLTLKGRGLPLLKSRSRSGDLFVKVQLDVPTTVTEDQRRRLRALDSELAAAPSPLRTVYDDLLLSRRTEAQEQAS